MAELEELEQEELDKNLLEISGPETVPLPNVPSISIPSKPGKCGSETPWVVTVHLHFTFQSLTLLGMMLRIEWRCRRGKPAAASC